MNAVVVVAIVVASVAVAVVNAVVFVAIVLLSVAVAVGTAVVFVAVYSVMPLQLEVLNDVVFVRHRCILRCRCSCERCCAVVAVLRCRCSCERCCRCRHRCILHFRCSCDCCCLCRIVVFSNAVAVGAAGVFVAMVVSSVAVAVVNAVVFVVIIVSSVDCCKLWTAVVLRCHRVSSCRCTSLCCILRCRHAGVVVSLYPPLPLQL